METSENMLKKKVKNKIVKVYFDDIKMLKRKHS